MRGAASNVPSEDPKQKAQSVLDALPGNSLIAKTAILSAGAGLSVAAISNEVYVFNEESITALSLLTVYWAIWKYGGPMYSEWANKHVERVNNVLTSARADHKNAVKERYDSVKQLSGVVDVTKQLFEVSKVRCYPYPVSFFFPFQEKKYWLNNGPFDETDVFFLNAHVWYMLILFGFLGDCPAGSEGI